MSKWKAIAGTVFRIIAFFWIINGAAGIILGFLDTSSTSFMRGLVSALLGWGLFRLGTWMKNKSPETASDQTT